MRAAQECQLLPGGQLAKIGATCQSSGASSSVGKSSSSNAASMRAVDNPATCPIRSASRRARRGRREPRRRSLPVLAGMQDVRKSRATAPEVHVSSARARRSSDDDLIVIVQDQQRNDGQLHACTLKPRCRGPESGDVPVLFKREANPTVTVLFRSCCTSRAPWSTAMMMSGAVAGS